MHKGFYFFWLLLFLAHYFQMNGEKVKMRRENTLLVSLFILNWAILIFSRGRSGGLIFPSLSEFSTVYCDPHSQRLWHSQ